MLVDLDDEYEDGDETGDNELLVFLILKNSKLNNYKILVHSDLTEEESKAWESDQE